MIEDKEEYNTENPRKTEEELREEERREEYKKQYIEKLYESLADSKSKFDKQVLWIASGAFGISFAFIEKIVKLNAATNTSFLILTWSLYTLVIFISLFSHFYSSRSISWSIKNCFQYGFEEGLEKRNKRTRIFNISTMVGIFIGTISLLVFIALNV